MIWEFVAPKERAAVMISGLTELRADSVIRPAKGVLPIVIDTIAGHIPIVVPTIKRVNGKRATIRIIVGNDRIMSVILDRIMYTHLFGVSPRLLVVNRIKPKINPKNIDKTTEKNSILRVAVIAGKITVGR